MTSVSCRNALHRHLPSSSTGSPPPCTTSVRRPTRWRRGFQGIAQDPWLLPLSSQDFQFGLCPFVGYLKRAQFGGIAAAFSYCCNMVRSTRRLLLMIEILHDRLIYQNCRNDFSVVCIWGLAGFASSTVGASAFYVYGCGLF